MTNDSQDSYQSALLHKCDVVHFWSFVVEVCISSESVLCFDHTMKFNRVQNIDFQDRQKH